MPKTNEQLKATQEIISIADIRDNLVVLENGELRAVLKVSGINFNLYSTRERERVLYAFQTFLNGLDFPIQILVQSRSVNLNAYLEKLKDPRWQKKRLEIFERDNFTCKHCERQDVTLNVHHLKYIKDLDPWEYADCYLITLCEKCHKDIKEIEKYYTHDFFFWLIDCDFLPWHLEGLLMFLWKNDKKYFEEYLKSEEYQFYKKTPIYFEYHG